MKLRHTKNCANFWATMYIFICPLPVKSIKRHNTKRAAFCVYLQHWDNLGDRVLVIH